MRFWTLHENNVGNKNIMVIIMKENKPAIFATKKKKELLPKRPKMQLFWKEIFKDFAKFFIIFLRISRSFTKLRN